MAVSGKPLSTDGLSAIVHDCLLRNTNASDRLAIGLSGGVDSVVLLDVLRRTNWSLKAIHVHHGLSAYADKWAEFCIALCDKWSIPLAVEHVAVDKCAGDGIEAAARRARHTAYGCHLEDWIVVGHHRGDRAETLLLNLVRGTGVRGAGAMKERNGRLLRPLLRVGRGDICYYAHVNNLTWVEDDSNANVSLARNYVRHRVLPAIADRFPATEKRMFSAAEHFAEAAELLDELALIDIGDYHADFPLDINILSGLSEPRARNVVRFLLNRRGIGVPSEARLIEILRQCLFAKADRHPTMTFGNWRIVRRKNQIVLESR
jgi:tRNA(Ile)-lysidine synthase